MFTVHIAGHLGKDPETRFTPSGQKVTTFSIATNQRKGKEDVTIWVRVTIWGDRFDKILPYLKKGSAVIVTGRMNPPSSYTDKEGRTQISLEVTAEMIEFSPFGKTDREGQTGTQAGQAQTGQTQAGGYTPYEAPYQTQTQHEENNYQANAAPYSKPPATYGAQQTGQGSYAQAADEDGLPF